MPPGLVGVDQRWTYDLLALPYDTRGHRHAWLQRYSTMSDLIQVLLYLLCISSGTAMALLRTVLWTIKALETIQGQ